MAVAWPILAVLLLTGWQAVPLQTGGAVWCLRRAVDAWPVPCSGCFAACTCARTSLTLPLLPSQIARDFGLAGEGGGTPGAGSGKGRGKKGEATSGALPQPLTREAAIAVARKRCEAFTLPHKLSCGVTVTNLGTLHPADHREWMCWWDSCTAVLLWLTHAGAVAGPAGQPRMCCRGEHPACSQRPVLLSGWLALGQQAASACWSLPPPPCCPPPPPAPLQTFAPRSSCGRQASALSGRMRRACASSTPSLRRPAGPCSGAAGELCWLRGAAGAACAMHAAAEASPVRANVPPCVQDQGAASGARGQARHRDC